MHAAYPQYISSECRLGFKPLIEQFKTQHPSTDIMATPEQLRDDIPLQASTIAWSRVVNPACATAIDTFFEYSRNEHNSVSLTLLQKCRLGRSDL